MMLPPQVATMPNSLYESLQCTYFVGFATDVSFEAGQSAWAALYNPHNSGVNLFVNVWTVTQISTAPIRVALWLNTTLPGIPLPATSVTPTNTTCCPLATPSIEFLHASNVTGTPTGGAEAYERYSVPLQTLVSEEDGKFIIPPGGNFVIFLSSEVSTLVAAQTRVAFGWWEVPICHY